MVVFFEDVEISLDLLETLLFQTLFDWSWVGFYALYFHY